MVRLPNGLTQRVTVRADDSGKGAAMLEARYGRGCGASILEIGLARAYSATVRLALPEP